MAPGRSWLVGLDSPGRRSWLVQSKSWGLRELSRNKSSIAHSCQLLFYIFYIIFHWTSIFHITVLLYVNFFLFSTILTIILTTMVVRCNETWYLLELFVLLLDSSSNLTHMIMNHELGRHVGCKGMVGLLYQIWIRFIDKCRMYSSPQLSF